MSRRWKGARDLAFDGFEVVARLVEKTQREESTRWARRAAISRPTAALAGAANALHLAGVTLTHTSIRLASRTSAAAVRGASDVFLTGSEGLPTPMREASMGTPSWWVDHVESAVNGFFGDFLSARGNALDLGMTLRHEGRVVPIEERALRAIVETPRPHVCLFVHGLSATEWSWVVGAEDFWGDTAVSFGTKLGAEGITPLYVRYNTGRHVSESGRALSELLETLASAYPVPIETLTLVGHSMGGLVCRSAAHHAAQAGAHWVTALRHLFCIGSPHLGAPLEKGVHAMSAVLRCIPAGGASVCADLLDARSAGIKDLRHGYTIDEEWRDEAKAVLHDNRHDVPLVDGVSYYAIAATVTRDPEHPAGRLLGDLLVRRGSASGLADAPARHIPFQGREVLAGMNHLHLANHPAVYAVVARALGLDEPAYPPRNPYCSMLTPCARG